MQILGARRFENEVAMRTSVPGVATGLAWTPSVATFFHRGGEDTRRRRLVLTGQQRE
jgi:ATP-dependent Lon protease